MPTISLTDLVDIVSTGGTPKANKVKSIKYRPDYNPAFDFYKKIREGIIETHEDKLVKRNLDSCLINLKDIKKRQHTQK